MEKREFYEARQDLYFSAVVPVFNEVDSLNELYRLLTESFVHMGKSYEILFVDDGSRDGSLEKLLAIAAADTHVKVISFYNNYGKSAAYMAAFKSCSGQYVFTLDSDLQDVPSEMPKLLEAVTDGGYDLAIGWKQKRFNNEPLKKIPSFFYNRMKRKLFGLSLHDSNSGFRCMKRDVAVNLDLYGDKYRFIPEYSHMRGFKVTEVATKHQSRKFGKSKYGGSRFITGLMDLLSVRYLSAYSTKPLHFFGTLAIVTIFLGSLLELYVFIAKLNGSSFQTHIAAIIVGVLLIILGFIFTSIGLLAEMMSIQKGGMLYAVRLKKGFE